MTGATSALAAIATVASTAKSVQSLIAKPPKAPGPVGPAQAAPFNPSRPDALSRPGSLSDFSSFDPSQERSALATKGVNQGLGADENAYYKNLVQRSLIGEGNAVASDTSTLLPIESQYFSQQGMNTSGIMDFLKQLAGAQ